VSNTIGGIAPDLSRAVGDGFALGVPEYKCRGFGTIFNGCRPHERLKSGAELRLDVVHPRPAEIFALPAWNQTIEDEDD
jgi:hypothetical protein